MRVLVITNLFPNNQEPGRGIFNKQQFLRLQKHCSIRVIAPLPLSSQNISAEETIENIKVYHPRYLAIPFIGRLLSGYTFYLSIKNLAKQILHDFPYDVILATWAFPDGFAASLLSKDLNKPLVIKLHGTDINVGLQSPLRKKMIASSLHHASKIIAVSRPLKEKVKGLGINEGKIELLGNGVDKNLFKPMDKQSCRKQLGFDPNKKYILFVGNLVAIKGVNDLIEAFKQLDENFILNMIGTGDLSTQLQHTIDHYGLSDRIRLQGRKPHQEIAVWMNASDIFCLPSLNEGCPNVIVEAVGCGVPIVATKVGAIPELLMNYSQSILVNPKDSVGLAQAIKDIDRKPKEKTEINYLSWEDNAQKLFKILEEACR